MAINNKCNIVNDIQVESDKDSVKQLEKRKGELLFSKNNKVRPQQLKKINSGKKKLRVQKSPN